MFGEARNDRIEVDNGPFRLVISRQDGLLQQAIYAPARASDPVVVSLAARSGSDGNILSPPFTEAQLERPSEDRVVIRLHGIQGPHDFTGVIELHKGDEYLHYTLTDTVRGTATVEALQTHYELTDPKLDFCYAPYIRPETDHVVAQQSFKSPALIMQQGRTLVSLVPDVDLINSEFPKNRAEVCIEIDADPDTVPRPIFGYGFKRNHPHGLLYFRHTPDMVREYRDETLRYGFYLYIKADAEEKCGYQQVVRFLWERFAKPLTREVLPQTLSFDRYATQGMEYGFNELWQDFEVDGVKCGAMLSGIRYPNDIWFHSSYNALRTAYHLYWFGRKWGKPALIEKAQRAKNLILLSPRKKGAFSTIFHRKVWFGRPVPTWVSSTHWNSEEFAALHAKAGHPMVVRGLQWDKLYQTVSCSSVACWMLKWYRDLEQDPKLLDMARAWGDTLLEIQLPSGAIPAWIDVETFEPEEALKESVDAAASGWLLSELYQVTGDARYLAAAEKVARFIETQIMDRQKWQDFETFYDSLAKPLDFYDPHSHQYIQNTFGLYWTSLMFRSLWGSTKKEEYRTLGCKAVDYLSLFQAVWKAPFMSMYTFGGIAVANGHPIWSDARTNLVASVFLEYYDMTGRLEYLERGIAAIRNLMGMMFTPENKAVSKWYSRGPLGSTDEAYSHRGEDTPWTGTGYDWGVGTTLNAIAYLEQTFGDLHVDLERNLAVGLDGCRVTNFRADADTVNIDVEDRVQRTTPLLVKMRNLTSDHYTLTLNGKEVGSYTKGELESGVRVKLPGSDF